MMTYDDPTTPSDREQVVAKLFVIPHPYSASTRSQKGVNLQNIKDEVRITIYHFLPGNTSHICSFDT